MADVAGSRSLRAFNVYFALAKVQQVFLFLLLFFFLLLFYKNNIQVHAYAVKSIQKHVKSMAEVAFTSYSPLPSPFIDS